MKFMKPDHPDFNTIQLNLVDHRSDYIDYDKIFREWLDQQIPNERAYHKEKATTILGYVPMPGTGKFVSYCGWEIHGQRYYIARSYQNDNSIVGSLWQIKSPQGVDGWNVYKIPTLLARVLIHDADEIFWHPVIGYTFADFYGWAGF